MGQTQKGLKMKRMIVLVALAASIRGSAADPAGLTETAWQPVNEVWSGAFADGAHWPDGEPGALKRVVFTGQSGGYTVTMPAGESGTLANFKVIAPNNTSVTLDFTDSDFLQQTAEADNYSSMPYWFATAGAGHFDYLSSGSDSRSAVSRLTGTVLTVSNEDGRPSVSFAGGTANFYDPEGTPRAASQDFIMFGKSGSSYESARMAFENGASLRAFGVTMNGFSTEEELLFSGDGASKINGILTLDSGTTEGVNRVVVTNGATLNVVGTSKGAISVVGAKKHEVIISDGATLDLDAALYSEATATEASITVLPGGTLCNSGNLDLNAKNDAATPFRINVRGGTVSSGSYLELNNSSSGALEMNLESGVIDASKGSGITPYRGNAKLTVNGGLLKVNNIYVGMNNGGEPKCIQNGGEIEASGAVYVAYKGTASGHLELNGGVCTTPYVLRRDGTGTATFSANGGTLRKSADSANPFISGFTEVPLGANGLTLDIRKAATVPQKFVNASGAEGKLVKTGSAALTLSAADSEIAKTEVREGRLVYDGAASCVTELTVAGGAVSFGGSAATTGPTALTFGEGESAGTVELAKGETVKVSGPLAIVGALNLVLGGGFAVGDAQTAFEVAGEVSDATKATWTTHTVVTGLAEGLVADCTIEAGEGVTLFKVNVREQVNTVKTVESGTETVETVKFNRNDTYTAATAEGATLDISGFIGYGSFFKTGLGKVVFPAVADLFGATLQGGIIELREGTMDLKFVVDVANDGAMSFRVPSGAATVSVPDLRAGAIVKTGAGALTFEVGAETARLTVCKGAFASGGNGAIPSTTGTMDLSDGVTPVTAEYGGLSVAEGTLRVKGVSREMAFATLENMVFIGLPVKPLSGGVQPGLVLEDVTVNAGDVGTSHVQLAPSVNKDNSDALAPALAMTNATLRCYRFYAAQDVVSGTVATPKVTLNDSTLYSKQTFGANPANAALNTRVTYELSNGSEIRAPGGIEHKNFIDFIVDGSVIGGENGTEPIVVTAGNKGGGSMTFRNGSVFHCNSFATAANEMTVSFEDSEWDAGDADFDFMLSTTSKAVAFTVSGAGVTFAPGEGRTWTVHQPIAGTGGVVKSGKGTLVFDTAKYLKNKVETAFADPKTACFTGTLDVREGMVVFNEGTYDPALTLAGAGTVRGAALQDATIRVGGSPLTFDGCMFGGRTVVDLGYTEESPLPEPYGEIAVAKFTGAAPDVSKWKLAGTGVAKLRGTFTAKDDGTVTVLPNYRGLMLIVR